MGTLIGSTFRNVNAMQFNGVDEFVFRDGSNGLTNTQGFLSFWYRPTTILSSDGARGIISIYNPPSLGPTLSINLRRAAGNLGASNRIEVACRNNSGLVYTVYAATTTAILAGTWHHVLIIKGSGSSYNIFINNVSQTVNAWFSEGGGQTSLWFGSMTAITSPRLAFGRHGTIYSDCRLDGIVFGTTSLLTSGQRTALYNSGNPGNPHRIAGIGMTHWYRCGESRDDATTLYDEVGSNHMTLTNMDASNYVAR